MIFVSSKKENYHIEIGWLLKGLFTIEIENKPIINHNGIQEYPAITIAPSKI